MRFIMSLRDAYKKKAEAEVDLAQAKQLAEFKAKVKALKLILHVNVCGTG
jgi:hypothetical protein